MYVSALPDGDAVPDDACSIYDTAGNRDGSTRDMTNFNYGIQIRLRAISYQDGWENLWMISRHLCSMGCQEVELEERVFNISSVIQTTQVIPIGVEDGSKRRFHFTVNLIVSMKEV